jgi:hypothetical protein
MSLDLKSDYNKAKSKIQATKSYKDLKGQYDKAQKKVGDSLEKGKDTLSDSKEKFEEQLDVIKNQAKRYQTEKKNQLEELLDINKVTGNNSVRYIKQKMIKALQNIRPKIDEILIEEAIKAVGCDQQQTYDPVTIYVKVKSVDPAGLLKKNPTSKVAKILYEKDDVVIQNFPFSFNKELYNRVQNPGQLYSTANGQNYFGNSGNELLDISFVEFNNFGESGPWFQVDLKQRVASSPNVVGEFLVDYFKTINIFEFTNVMANIMNSLSGAISIKANVGVNEVTDSTKFERYIARILGLCFDNRKQIDVSGVAKVAELDGIDESFYELTQIELRNVENKVSNIQNGVVEFEDCDTEKLPVNADQIVDALNQLNFVEGRDLDKAADSLSDILAQNPAWKGLAINGNIKAAIDLNFIKLITQGLVFALLGPKVLLPIFTMLKAIGKELCGNINGFVDLLICFKEFMKELISKIGSLFIKELFKLIKRDILNLIQAVIKDLSKELKDKRIIMILKLVQLILVVAQFVRDWRECKSVVDEILWLLNIALSGWGSQIPLPLLYASQLLDGFSATRAYIGTIEELQKIGVPTGPMPDGSPNLTVLSMLSQLKAQVTEEAENGKVQIALPPLTITPAGLTVPQSAFGKKF